jgi:hypothetical protein
MLKSILKLALYVFKLPIYGITNTQPTISEALFPINQIIYKTTEQNFA